MSNKLTIDNIINAAQSFGCRAAIIGPVSMGDFCAIEGADSAIVQAITSLIESATLDANIKCGKIEERRIVWRDRAHKAEAELRESWADYAGLQAACDELRQQLAAAQNDVKQLRAARDKRRPEYVHVTVNGDTRTYYDRRKPETQADGSVLLRDPVTGKAWTADGTEAGKWSAAGNPSREREDQYYATAEDYHQKCIAKVKPAAQDAFPEWKLAVLDKYIELLEKDHPAMFGNIRTEAADKSAVSEVMAAMHEDESEPLKKRLGKFTATVISAMRESIAEDAKKVIGKISEQAAIQDCIADEDGWIEWDGDVTRPWPVPLGTRIEYKLRDGYIDQRPCASMLIWRNDGAGSDIIAYRIPK